MPEHGNHLEKIAREELLKKAISGCNSLEDLYGIIREEGTIPGSSSGGQHGAQEVIQVIERMRHGHFKEVSGMLRFPPRAYGIREKVKQLLENDSVFIKEKKRGRVRFDFTAMREEE